MLLSAALLLSLPSPEGGRVPPTEFRLLAAGKNPTLKGEVVFDEESARQVLGAWREHGTELAFDYEHQALQQPPIEAPAAGWFGLELRNGELWAVNVKWTPRAAERLQAAEYRYFSPALELDPKTRRIRRFVNAALTNLPATRALSPLVAATQTAGLPAPEKPMKTLLTLLALAETATEAEAVTALTALQARERELLTLTGAATAAEAAGKVAGWKAAAGQLEATRAEVLALKAKADEAEGKALLDGAVRDGKVPPALKEFWGKQPLETLRAFVAAAPVLTPSISKPPAASPDALTLTASEQKAAKEMGVDPAKMLERKKALLQTERAEAAES